MSRRGLFMTLEGPEGSGKSSQGRWLVERLRRAGHRVVWLRDPGSTALGRQLRHILLHTREPLSPLTEALLFIGGRVQLVEERILPALQRGQVVVCDRFHDATVAYQGFGGGLAVPWLERLGRRAIHHVMPSLTILLDLSTAQGFGRLHRSRDRMEQKTRRFHQRVRRGYLALAWRQPRRFIIIDASAPRNEVRHRIAQALARRRRLTVR